MHVDIVVHEHVEIEILEASCHELGSWGGDVAIKEDLGGSEIASLGADGTFVAYLVSVNGNLVVFCLYFSLSIGGNDVEIHWSLVLENCRMWDKVHCLSFGNKMDVFINHSIFKFRPIRAH